jgi:hypothetical protein
VGRGSDRKWKRLVANDTVKVRSESTTHALRTNTHLTEIDERKFDTRAFRLYVATNIYRGLHADMTNPPSHRADKKNKQKTPWSLVLKRTIPTGRPPLVEEI